MSTDTSFRKEGERNDVRPKNTLTSSRSSNQKRVHFPARVNSRARGKKGSHLWRQNIMPCATCHMYVSRSLDSLDLKMIHDDEAVQDCAVDGTNCCCMTNHDCGEGNVCNTCGCQCRPDDGIMKRCDSSCEAGLGEALIFRP